MHAKTIIFVVGIATGIVAGFASPFASEIVIATMLLVVLQAALLLVERRESREESGERNPPTSLETSRGTRGFSLALFTILFSVGIILGTVRVQLVEEKSPYVCESACTFDAVVVSSPETKDVHQTLIVRVPEESDNAYDVQLRVPLYPTFAIGETLRISGKANVPDVIFPHGDEKSFDYASYLHTKNVGSEMMFPKIEVIDYEAHTVSDMLGRWKEDMVSRMNTYIASPASSLASGMLFGNSSMSKDLVQTFRVAGLSHIIVLSGFNIAIVIGFVLFMFTFLPLVMRIILAPLFVVAFVVMVGAEPSIMRASFMAFIGLFAMLVGREYVARQALVLSLFAIVMYEPSALMYGVSLHLSFLATAGIVYLSAPIKKSIGAYVNRSTLLELMTTTLAAYLITLPYVMYTFGTVSVYAFITNIIVLPFVPITMLLSFLTILSSYVSETVALLFGYADTILINAILFIANTAERLPFSQFVLTISFISMAALYGVIVFVIFFFSKKVRDETWGTNEAGYLTDIIKY